MMLAASLVMTQEGDNLKQDKLSNVLKFILIIAPGEPLLITRCILGSSRSSERPVILSLENLQQHSLVLNFASNPMIITNPMQSVYQKTEAVPNVLQTIIEGALQLKS